LHGVDIENMITNAAKRTYTGGGTYLVSATPESS
jgi:hypothetical protein